MPMPERVQRWRAVARFKDGSSSLILLGASVVQVRTNYLKVFDDPELFTAEARANCSAVVIEQWKGDPDRGSWVRQNTISMNKAVA